MKNKSAKKILKTILISILITTLVLGVVGLYGFALITSGSKLDEDKLNTSDNYISIVSADGKTFMSEDSTVNLEDLNESLKTDFPATDFDSLGGFAFDIFGKIPAKFEKATYKNYDFIIQDMEGHRINVIKIIKRGDTPSESEE